MIALDMDELVSQAERDGVTLAEIIGRRLTPGQLDEIQDGIRVELASNYDKIAGFMTNVKVPSLEEIMNSSELTDSDRTTAEA